MRIDSQRQCLLVETASGHEFICRQRLDGSWTWKKRKDAQADQLRLVAATDTSSGELCISDILRFQEELSSTASSDLPLASAAEKLFAAATAAVRKDVEPIDATGEQPPASKSQCGGRCVEFSLEPLKAFDPAVIRVEEVQPVDRQFRRFGGRCLVLHNVLAAEECEYLINEMSRDMEPVRYRQDYRRNDRCVFDSPELAELLYKRVAPVASKLSVCVTEDPAKQHLLAEEPADCPQELQVGYGKEGVWHAHGLNECLRFCRYTAGGFFRKHVDAPFIRNEDEQSLFTCMFYLNGDLDGGATRFLKINSGLSVDDQFKQASDSDVLASVAPEAGMCMLFFQPGLLHEGEDLHSGVKHILRTDVVYRRDPATKLQRTPEQIKGLELVRQAEAASTRGELDLACSLYRRAFKLDPELEKVV